MPHCLQWGGMASLLGGLGDRFPKPNRYLPSKSPAACCGDLYLFPVLQQALADVGLRPEREAHRVAVSPLVWEGTPDLAIDGTERRRQRPTNPTWQKKHDSGKKKAHTDKNLLLVNETTRKVVYLGPTIPGKTHDKKAADEATLAYMTNATLDKDTGFQGYE